METMTHVVRIILRIEDLKPIVDTYLLAKRDKLSYETDSMFKGYIIKGKERRNIRIYKNKMAVPIRLISSLELLKLENREILRIDIEESNKHRGVRLIKEALSSIVEEGLAIASDYMDNIADVNDYTR